MAQDTRFERKPHAAHPMSKDVNHMSEEAEQARRALQESIDLRDQGRSGP